MRQLLLALLALAIPAMTRAAAPALTGRVVDEARLLPPATAAALTDRLAAYERRTRHQLVVVTVTSLGGETIEAFTLALANRWGIGRKGADDGILLLVAPTECKTRIEVGRGLERRLTNARAATIIETRMLPPFRAGDFPRGIDGGVDAIIAAVPD